LTHKMSTSKKTGVQKMNTKTFNTLYKVRCDTCLKLCPKKTAKLKGDLWICANCRETKNLKNITYQETRKVYCELCRESILKKNANFKDGFLICKNCKKKNAKFEQPTKEFKTTILLTLEQVNEIFNEGKNRDFITNSLMSNKYHQPEPQSGRKSTKKRRTGRPPSGRSLQRSRRPRSN
jgi:ribosomal protein L37AE/L43A